MLIYCADRRRIALAVPPLVIVHDCVAISADEVDAATCVAAVRTVCKSTAFAPRALPPVAVPSGTARQKAPVPFGTSEIDTFVVPPVA